MGKHIFLFCSRYSRWTHLNELVRKLRQHSEKKKTNNNKKQEQYCGESKQGQMFNGGMGDQNHLLMFI